MCNRPRKGAQIQLSSSRCSCARRAFLGFLLSEVRRDGPHASNPALPLLLPLPISRRNKGQHPETQDQAGSIVFSFFFPNVPVLSPPFPSCVWSCDSNSNFISSTTQKRLKWASWLARNISSGALNKTGPSLICSRLTSAVLDSSAPEEDLNGFHISGPILPGGIQTCWISYARIRFCSPRKSVLVGEAFILSYFCAFCVLTLGLE